MASKSNRRQTRRVNRSKSRRVSKRKPSSVSSQKEEIKRKRASRRAGRRTEKRSSIKGKSKQQSRRSGRRRSRRASNRSKRRYSKKSKKTNKDSGYFDWADPVLNYYTDPVYRKGYKIAKALNIYTEEYKNEAFGTSVKNYYKENVKKINKNYTKEQAIYDAIYQAIRVIKNSLKINNPDELFNDFDNCDPNDPTNQNCINYNEKCNIDDRHNKLCNILNDIYKSKDTTSKSMFNLFKSKGNSSSMSNFFKTDNKNVPDAKSKGNSWNLSNWFKRDSRIKADIAIEASKAFEKLKSKTKTNLDEKTFKDVFTKKFILKMQNGFDFEDAKGLAEEAAIKEVPKITDFKDTLARYNPLNLKKISSQDANSKGNSWSMSNLV
jgi:hypothetical protein